MTINEYENVYIHLLYGKRPIKSDLDYFDRMHFQEKALAVLKKLKIEYTVG